MRRNWLILLLVVALLACAGCKSSTGDKTNDGQQTQQTEQAETDPTDADDVNAADTEVKKGITLPIEGETAELSLWISWSNTRLESIYDVLSVQEMERQTNVHIDYAAVAPQEATEKFGLMLASGDMPDIIHMSPSSYPGGLEKAVEDGILVDLTDYVELLPNYDALRRSDEKALKDTLTDDGRSIIAYSLNGNNEGVALEEDFLGMSIRKDWLDEQGYAIPETIDEWHDALVMFRDVYGCEGPLALASDGTYTFGYFTSAFGVLPEFFEVNGEVHYGPLEEGYRSYVELMRDWYAEGLIDPNFVSNDASLFVPYPEYATGKYGAGPTAWGFSADLLRTSFGLASDEDFYIVGTTAPVLNKGDQSATGYTGSSYTANGFAVSTNCENIELAAAWIDYQFTEAGMQVNNYGIEGTTWVRAEDGGYDFTEYMTAAPDASFNDMLNMTTWGPTNVGWYNWQKYEKTYDPESKKCQKEWAKDDKSMALPRVSLTDAEGVEYSTLYTAISTLVQEKTVKYIMGTESMDTYDVFVQSLKDYGIDRCLEIQQTALDRYNNR